MVSTVAYGAVAGFQMYLASVASRQRRRGLAVAAALIAVAFVYLAIQA